MLCRALFVVHHWAGEEEIARYAFASRNRLLGDSLVQVLVFSLNFQSVFVCLLKDTFTLLRICLNGPCCYSQRWTNRLNSYPKTLPVVACLKCKVPCIRSLLWSSSVVLLLRTTYLQSVGVVVCLQTPSKFCRSFICWGSCTNEGKIAILLWSEILYNLCGKPWAFYLLTSTYLFLLLLLLLLLLLQS